jgi:hypothetical protein
MEVPVAGVKSSGPGMSYGGNPSTDPKPNGFAPGLKAEVWAELGAGDGAATAVYTGDDQRLTWGRGFSVRVATKLPEVVDAFFAADPGAKDELMRLASRTAAASGCSWTSLTATSWRATPP